MSKLYQCKDGVITPLNFFGTGIAYDICEFYYFRNPNLKPGFYPANGGLIENADIVTPLAFDYLQKDGSVLCVSSEEWASMSNNQYFSGIGGVPYYSIDVANKTIKLPDLRGMYPQGATENIGTVKEPGLPNITGKLGLGTASGFVPIRSVSGAFTRETSSTAAVNNAVSSSTTHYFTANLTASRSSSIYGNSNTVQPPSYTLYATVYLGVTL